jgi:hypothetical protein
VKESKESQKIPVVGILSGGESPEIKRPQTTNSNVAVFQRSIDHTINHNKHYINMASQQAKMAASKSILEE